MVGLNHKDLEKALDILKRHGERTVVQYQPLISGSSVQPMATAIPVPTHLGGVVLFVLDIERHERY